MASSPYGPCSSTRLVILWWEGVQRWGWVCDRHALPLVLAGCRLHQTEEKSRLHGCICSNKFLVAGDYCVKVRTTLGEALWSLGYFYGPFLPPTQK